MEFKKVDPIDKDGWSEWISPKKKGYLMKCCDCGLIHEVDFEVVKFTGEVSDDGMSRCEIIEDEDYAANFRVRRYEVEQVQEG